MSEAGFIRIPGARPIRRLKPDVQTREQSWDNRFYLDKIPEYNGRNDSYPALNPVQSRGAPRKKKVVMAPGRLRVIRSPIKEIEAARPLKAVASGGPKTKNPLVSNQILRSLFTEVRFVWDEKEIPEEHRSIFMETLEGIPLRKKAVAIAKHIEELISNKAMVQYVLRTITAREKALKKLQGLCDFATQAGGLEDSAVQQVIDLLSAFRLLSLNVVECVTAWREQLSAINPTEMKLRKAPFAYEGQNYFLKMRNDIDFVKQTPLTLLFEFAEGLDPFLKALANNKRSRTKLELPIPYAMKSRINKAEFLIVEETSLQPTSNPYAPKSNLSSRRDTHETAGPATASPPVEKTMNVRALSQERVQKDDPMRQSRRRLNDIRESLELKPEELPSPPSPVTIVGVEGDVELALETYMAGVPAEVKETFGDAKTTYAAVMKSPYPCFLWLMQRKSVVGLVAFNIDTQSMLQKRLIVNHFSCVHSHQLAELLKAALEYLWLQYPADEVRVALAYRDIDGKYEIDADIKARFDELGFKWKNLTNTGDGKRLLLMGLRRPEGQTCTNEKAALMFQETIVLNLATVVACGADVSQGDDQLTGLACIATLLAALQQLPLKEGETPSDLVGMLKKAGASFKFPAIKASSSEDPADALKLAIAQGFQFDVPAEAVKTGVAASSLGFTWLKFLPVKASVGDRQYAYNYIRESEVSVVKTVDRHLYIIPIDRAFSVFVIPGLVEGDVFSETKRLLQGISEVVDVKDSILIPSFKLLRKSTIRGVQAGLQDLHLLSTTEEFILELRTTLHPQGSSVAAPASVLKVEGDFVFGEIYAGFMHSQLEEKLEVPYFAVQVTPDAWISI